MKKYLLGLFAVVLAITLNSFTTIKSDNDTRNDFIWYLVENGVIDPNSPINPGDPVDEMELEAEYFECPGSGQLCARGFAPNALPTSSTDVGISTTEKN